MQTAAQAADPTEETFEHPWLINKKPPMITSGGKRKAVFGGYARSTQLGRPFKAPQPVTLGLSGFGGGPTCLQPIVGWKKTMTPGDVNLHRRFIEVWEVSPKRSSRRLSVSVW